MQLARIYQPAKSAMQSGKANTKHWCLEFIPANERFIEPVMGWIGSSDMFANEVKLFFPTKEEAIHYAQNKNISFEVFEPKKPDIKINPYSKNFI